MAKPYCRPCKYCGQFFEVPPIASLRAGPNRKRFCRQQCAVKWHRRRAYFQAQGKEPPPLVQRKRKKRYGQPIVKPNPSYRPFIPSIDWSGKGGELIEE